MTILAPIWFKKFSKTLYVYDILCVYFSGVFTVRDCFSGCFGLHYCLKTGTQRSCLIIVKAFLLSMALPRRIMFSREGQLTILSDFYRLVANTLAVPNAIVFIAQT